MKKISSVKLFYSYCHEDKAYCDELTKHLSVLKREGAISEWYDRKIEPGKNWEKEINQNLKASDVILLLISSDFVASDYCYCKEMEEALRMHDANQARIVPIIIRPVDWSSAPFAALQFLPEDAVPVSAWDNRDEAWLNVVEGIRKVVDNFKINTGRTSRNKFVSSEEILKKELKRFESIYENENYFGGLMTGYKDLDMATDGIHDSDLFVLASRPSMGRSDFSINIIKNIAIDREIPVAYFSMALSSDHIMRRLLSLTSYIKLDDLVKGELGELELVSYLDAVAKVSKASLFIMDSLSLSVEDIKKNLTCLKKEHDIQLIVIDSLQHIRCENRNDILPEFQIINSLKNIIKEFKTPILATSQVLESTESRFNKRPTFFDMGSWSVLEEEADIFAFLYRDEVYDVNTYDKGIMEVIISKNRYGANISLILGYIDEVKKITDLALNEYELSQDD